MLSCCFFFFFSIGKKINDEIICLMTWIVQQKYKHVKQEKKLHISTRDGKSYKGRSVYSVHCRKKCANEEASSHYHLTSPSHRKEVNNSSFAIYFYYYFSWMSESALYFYIFFISYRCLPFLFCNLHYNKRSERQVFFGLIEKKWERRMP